MLHEVCQGMVNGLGSDHMIVIKDEYEILYRLSKEVVDQQGEHGL
jgi:hypothetical protein